MIEDGIRIKTRRRSNRDLTSLYEIQGIYHTSLLEYNTGLNFDSPEIYYTDTNSWVRLTVDEMKRIHALKITGEALETFSGEEPPETSYR
ncbi:MAG: hypothetical protein QXI32_06570 [Candidatus Bathyarchaeia archaeon]